MLPWRRLLAAATRLANFLASLLSLPCGAVSCLMALPYSHVRSVVSER